MSGQTLTDRIAAAQYQLTGSDMARAVCKATTHEVMAPKKKHLEYLISATNATNVNIPQMADTLFERATNASWVVVFKALVTTHHMCVHGNERFIQYLASRTALFNLSNFIDKTGSHGYDMSTFIRRYGRYLNEKAFAYRQMAFDFTKVKKGADGVMRTMTPEKLLKGMPILQAQIDTLLEFDVHPKELNNGIINAAFLLLFKDLVKLFASYNDGVINLLEKYFKMKKSDCKEALEIYKRFLTRVTKIGEFMKLAETVGVEKNDIPDINYAPSSILDSLETHMNSLEDQKGGKKGDGSPTKGSPTNNVSPTSTPAKSAAVPTLEPPPAETATDSLLDLDPLSSSGPSAGASAAPTSWGDLLGSDAFSSPSAPADTPAAVEGGATEATPTPAADTGAESTGGEPQPAAHGAELMSGDVMKPAVPPQGSGASTIGASSPSKPMGDLDSTMANLAGNLAMGPAAPTQVAPPSWGAPMSGASGAGAPMMPMVRPGFPPAGASGAPMSPGIMAQSPRRPPPPKNALDDLNIKDFM